MEMHVEAWQDFTSAEVGSKDKRWLGLRRPNLKLSYSCMGDSLDTSAGFHRIYASLSVTTLIHQQDFVLARVERHISRFESQ